MQTHLKSAISLPRSILAAIFLSATVSLSQVPDSNTPVGLEDLQVLMDAGKLIHIDMQKNPPEFVVGGNFLAESAIEQAADADLMRRFVRGIRSNASSPSFVDVSGQRVTLKPVVGS